MRSWSLRTRLLVGVGAVAIVVIAVSLTVTRTISNQMIAQVDDRLDTLSVPDGRGGDSRRPAPPGDRRGGPGDRVTDIFQGSLDSNGELTAIGIPNAGGKDYGVPDIAAIDLSRLDRSGDGDNRRPGADRDVVHATTGSIAANTTYRVAARRAADGYTIVAVPIDNVIRTIRRLEWITLLGAVIIFGVLALVTWWVQALGIRPIKRMTENAASIAAGDLSVRVDPAPAGTEAGQLGNALNLMIGNIESAMNEQVESEQRLRRFLSDASHELRTPVTTIRGYAELYRHGGLGTPDALSDAMRRTEEESRRMGRLVEDMLVLARLDEQRPMQSDPVNLASTATDLAADVHAVDPDRVVSVQIVGDGAACTVIGDGDRLRQALVNIVNNARVHTDGPIELAVMPTVNGDGRPGVTFAVADHGAGMPADAVMRATERFYRADPSRSRHRGGSGLGLSIVDAIVVAHQGDLAIESQPGTGTTVRVWLPADGPTEA